MKDPREETDHGGMYCHFCKEDSWSMEHMKKTPWDEWICPNCRSKCDYCEQYFHYSEITRVADGEACSDCLFEHALLPLDDLELFDTLGSCLP